MGWMQITIEEREVIMIRREKGVPVERIARELNRHRSSIYRELGRNRDGLALSEFGGTAAGDKTAAQGEKDTSYEPFATL